MGAFCCHVHQSFIVICPKTFCSIPFTSVMSHIKFDQDWPIGLRHIQAQKSTTTDHLFTISSPCEPSAQLSPKGNDHSPVQCAKVKSHFKKHINGPWKPEARNRTRPSFNACSGYQNFDDDSIKNE